MNKLAFVASVFGCVFISSCSKKSSDELLNSENKNTSIFSSGEAGVLTAGEWNDLENWSFWLNLKNTNKDLQTVENTWQLYTKNRVHALVSNPDNMPLVNAKVVLKKNGVEVFEAKSDVQGNVELWPDLSLNSAISDQSAYEIFVEGEKVLTGFPNEINYVFSDQVVEVEDQVQVAFLVDATASMGDEIKFLKLDLADVIQRVGVKNPSAEIQTGSVFYRDKGDNYLTKLSSFTTDIATTTRFIEDQDAMGGGDAEEALDVALEEALSKLSWNDKAKSRLAFIFLDASPHENSDAIRSIQSSMEKAAKMGIRLIPIASSGVNSKTEFLMRTFAIITNGTYVFLTDDKGVGDKHIKATVGNFDEEYLNDLIVRLIHESMN